MRGLVRLGEAFAVIPLVKRGLPEAQAGVREPARARRRGRARRSPGTLVERRAPGTGGELAAALIALAPALFALRGGELAAYHGVEHKAIAAYEADDADAADAQKEHERCGSHLMAPMLAANLAGTLLLKRAMERPTRSPAGAVALASHRRGGRGLRLERASRRLAGSAALKRPGYELQRAFGTREPDERQLEVGRAALAEILRVEDSNEAQARAARPAGRGRAAPWSPTLSPARPRRKAFAARSRAPGRRRRTRRRS